MNHSDESFFLFVSLGEEGLPIAALSGSKNILVVIPARRLG